MSKYIFNWDLFLPPFSKFIGGRSGPHVIYFYYADLSLSLSLPSSLFLGTLQVWPSNLVTCALFNTLHSQQYAGIGRRGGLSRERFFYLAFLVSMAWYSLPGYLFMALSGFSWVCWMAPNNIVINQMFGYNSGLVCCRSICLQSDDLCSDSLLFRECH